MEKEMTYSAICKKCINYAKVSDINFCGVHDLPDYITGDRVKVTCEFMRSNGVVRLTRIDDMYYSEINNEDAFCGPDGVYFMAKPKCI